MEQPSLPTPHNNFFQFALANLANACSLLETQLPAEVVRELNLDSLALETGSFITPELREQRSDLLMSVQLVAQAQPSQDVLVYFLMEHKSQPDELTAVQLLSYIVRIWERRLRDGKKLCPILPLVIYHGQVKWTAARRIDELMEIPESLRAYQVRFGFPLLDLTQLSDEEIGGESILQSTLQLLKYSRSDRMASKLREILELVAASGIATVF